MLKLVLHKIRKVLSRQTLTLISCVKMELISEKAVIFPKVQFSVVNRG